jgi:hypothetical protein
MSEDTEAEEATPVITTIAAPAGTASTVTAPGVPVSSFTLPGTPAAAPVAPPKAKTKGKRAKMPSEMWSEIRTLYESGTYTQKDLVNFCKGRGFRITQPAISRRCMDEGWVRGKEREKLKAEIYAAIAIEKGEAVIKMLNLHRRQAQMLSAEALFHFQKVTELRKLDPQHVIPAQQLATLTVIFKEAQNMESRALGFNYKEGRPFKTDDEEAAEKPTILEIREMSPEQAAEIREAAEKRARGEDEGVE